MYKLKRGHPLKYLEKDLKNNQVKMVVAHDNQGGIAKNDKLPWGFIKEDMRFFKNEIKGKKIICSERLWKNTMHNLHPRKDAIVLNSKSKATPEEIMHHYRNDDIVIIGGKYIYERFAYFTDLIYTTYLDYDYECDLKLDLNKIYKHFNKCNFEIKLNDYLNVEVYRNGKDDVK